MEGLSRNEIVADKAQASGVERFAKTIESAQQGLARLKEFDGGVITEMAVYHEVERLAAEVSADLALIPGHIRAASGLPGGVIHSRQETANEGLYRAVA